VLRQHWCYGLLIKDECRDVLGVRLIDELWRESRYVVRALLKAPAFSGVVVLTLALAVAANSAMFGAVYAVLLKPLPISHPGDLAVFWGADTSRNRGVVELSYPTSRTGEPPAGA